MRKTFLFLLSVFCLTTLLPAQSTVPPELKGELTAFLGEYVSLLDKVTARIDASTNASQAAAAIRAFSADMRPLGQRFQSMKEKFPLFFNEEEKEEVKDPEFESIEQKIEGASERYMKAFAKVASWMDNPDLKAALEENGKIMEVFGDLAGEEEEEEE